MPEDRPVAALRAELAGEILGVVLSQAVYAAASLGIPDLLAEGPRSVTELAVAADADPDALYRLLRLLAGRGIFIELADGVFTNSASSELLRERPGSLGAAPGPNGHAPSYGQAAKPPASATPAPSRT
jgi:hypothetical protein